MRRPILPPIARCHNCANYRPLKRPAGFDPAGVCVIALGTHVVNAYGVCDDWKDTIPLDEPDETQPTCPAERDANQLDLL